MAQAQSLRGVMLAAHKTASIHTQTNPSRQVTTTNSHIRSTTGPPAVWGTHSRAGHFNFFFENLSWVVWNWMRMIKDSICQKFEVLNH